MTFSWADNIKKVEKMKIRRNRRLALNPTKDYQLKNPDFVREASQGKFTMLDKKTTENLNKFIQTNLQREKKLVGN